MSSSENEWNVLKLLRSKRRALSISEMAVELNIKEISVRKACEKLTGKQKVERFEKEVKTEVASYVDALYKAKTN